MNKCSWDAFDMIKTYKSNISFFNHSTVDRKQIAFSAVLKSMHSMHSNVNAINGSIWELISNQVIETFVLKSFTFDDRLNDKV